MKSHLFKFLFIIQEEIVGTLLQTIDALIQFLNISVNGEPFWYFNINKTIDRSMNKCGSIINLGGFKIEQNAHR